VRAAVNSQWIDLGSCGTQSSDRRGVQVKVEALP